MSLIRSFFIALQFLTRLPVRLATQPDEKELGYSLFFYPLVGLIIGVILVAVGWLLNGTPPFVMAALLITVWILLTGGLHLDGLADSADAWIGGIGDRERTLAIMKDPNCGPAGVVAIMLVILLKFAALYSLIITLDWISGLLVIILSRMLVPLLFLTTPYVRSNGLGSALAMHQPRQLNILMIISTIALIPLFTGTGYLELIITAITSFLIVRYAMLQRIGGMTGDTAGALIEVTETTMLLSAVVTFNIQF